MKYIRIIVILTILFSLVGVLLFNILSYKQPIGNVKTIEIIEMDGTTVHTSRLLKEDQIEIVIPLLENTNFFKRIVYIGRSSNYALRFKVLVTDTNGTLYEYYIYYDEVVRFSIGESEPSWAYSSIELYEYLISEFKKGS